MLKVPNRKSKDAKGTNKMHKGCWGHYGQKCFIFLYYFGLDISDWSIIMIAPGGLLLVVPHVYAVPVTVLLVGLPKKKKKQLNLDI
jgi:hypothetical protein